MRVGMGVVWVVGVGHVCVRVSTCSSSPSSSSLWLVVEGRRLLLLVLVLVVGREVGRDGLRVRNWARRIVVPGLLLLLLVLLVL